MSTGINKQSNVEYSLHLPTCISSVVKVLFVLLCRRFRTDKSFLQSSSMEFVRVLYNLKYKLFFLFIINSLFGREKTKQNNNN